MKFQGEFKCETRLAAPIEVVWDFFQTTENLARITSFPKVIVSGPSLIEEGKTMNLQLHFGFWKTSWNSHISRWKEKEEFEDIILEPIFPFDSWKHRHLFIPLSEHETKMTDTVQFTSTFPSFLVRIGLHSMFKDRERGIKKLMESTV